MDVVRAADDRRMLFPTAVLAWRWWTAALSDVLPRDSRSWLQRQVPCLEVLPDGQTEISVLSKKGRRLLVRLDHKGMEPGAGVARSAQRVFNGDRFASLVVADREALRKTIELPIMATADLHDVLVHQIDRLTPYGPEQVYWGYAVAGHDHANRLIAVNLTVIPKSRVKPRLEVARTLQLNPRSLALIDADQRISELVPLETSSSTGSRVTGWLPVAALLALNLLLVFAVLVQPYHRLLDRKAEVSAEMARVKPLAERAFRIRADLEAVMAVEEFLAAQHAMSIPILSVWRDVTRALPANAWLERLTVSTDKVQLTGYGQQAAQLIKRLEAVPSLADVSFLAPVTTSVRDGRERFQVGATWTGEPAR